MSRSDLPHAVSAERESCEIKTLRISAKFRYRCIKHRKRIIRHFLRRPERVLTTLRQNDDEINVVLNRRYRLREGVGLLHVVIAANSTPMKINHHRKLLVRIAIRGNV